jgi:hypothetical protein
MFGGIKNNLKIIKYEKYIKNKLPTIGTFADIFM